jgi:hypothetical protein
MGQGLSGATPKVKRPCRKKLPATAG